MLSIKREFHYTAQLTIHRSKLLEENTFPREDIINWLFIEIHDHQYSFVYTIDDPDKAQFNKPFEVKIAFTDFESVERIIMLNKDYQVYRGNELIGQIEILKKL